MSWLAPFYVACVVCLTLYAMAKGGPAERTAAAINAAASAITWAAYPSFHNSFRHPEIALGLIDGAACCGFFAVMVASRAFWPMWCFAFSLAGALAGIARLLSPEAHFLRYFTTESYWPYASMIAIAIGTAARSRPWMIAPRSLNWFATVTGTIRTRTPY